MPNSGGDEPASTAARQVACGAVKPLAVHHVSINVGDVAAAVAFYTGVLGLQLRSDRPDFGFGGAWLDAGGQQVHLIEGDVPPSRGQHFALEVDDLAAVVDELRGRGVAVSDPVKVAAGLQAFLNDPAGNSVELQQPRAV
jgi:catechol 2,3-dioxygenase-like lactoylglutathione lyase family enzyme